MPEFEPLIEFAPDYLTAPFDEMASVLIHLVYFALNELG